MTDISDLTNELSNRELELQARRHYTETSSYAAYWATKYERFHSYFAPLNGDQWPEDLAKRPGMIHVTHNIIAPAVEIESRIESRLPRLTLVPDFVDDETRARAEMAEKLYIRWLELTGWKTWLNDAAKTKSIYGKVVLKPRWNKRQKRPEVTVIESPQNLRIGWGSSDYTVMDWALYEYTLSPLEAMRRFPGITITFEGKGDRQRINVLRHSDHSDPLGQLTNLRNRNDVQPSDYENKQVRIWDYWAKQIDEDGEEHIVNAFFVEGVLAAEPKRHDYLPDLPYIVIEHDHVPGSPEGLGDVEPLIDVQIEMNRAFSHWAQLIADEIDPAYQLDADNLPPGMVAKGGQITAAGEGKQIRPIEKSVANFPIEQLVQGLYDAFHFRSGLSKILFTAPPGAQTAGRALHVQIEASANRIDPRRDRLYAGLEELLIFWGAMAEHANPEIMVGFDDQGQPVRKKIADVIRGFSRWKMIAPEITPRDNLEQITGVINKLNAKLISLEQAMDELGVDSPLAMIKMIEAERMNPRLFPADAQNFVAVLAMLQQYAMTDAQMQSAMGAATDPQGNAMAAAQGALPQGVQGDNASDVPQPATAAGGPPPPGAPGPGGLQNQTLIRSNAEGEGDVLNQIRVVS